MILKFIIYNTLEWSIVAFIQRGIRDAQGKVIRKHFNYRVDFLRKNVKNLKDLR